MNINTLWNNGMESVWCDALKKYNDIPSVKRNLDVERKISCVSPSKVKNMDAHEIYRFLFDDYFTWKYTAPNRLATTRKFLRKYEDEGFNDLKDILSEIFRLYDEKPNDTNSLMLVTTRIKGLGVAGASGVLSILFPEHYGTVDQFVVYSLAKIDGLPEHDIIRGMNPERLKIQDSVILEDIYRGKAQELNDKFHTKRWNPQKIDMILWEADRK